jgi:hypothetical protein
MSWQPKSLLERLNAAVDRFDRDEAVRLTGEIVAALHAGEAIDAITARKILGALRRKSYFEPMERVAEALHFTSQDDAQIRRQYAQALIDQRKLTGAVYVLGSLIEHTAALDPQENAEARGLLGRVYKQLYVNAVNADPKASVLALSRRNLQRAVDAYLGVYRSDPARHLWHGINAVALAARAAKDGVPLRDCPEPIPLAHEILATLAARGPRKELPAWDLATGAEAALAVGDPEGAVLWIGQYIQGEDADAFELASTLRQLTEVWGLTIDKMPGSLLLPVLQARLLQRSGGLVHLSAGDVQPTIQKTEEHAANAVQLEKILGKEGVVSLSWYRTGLDRTRMVAKVLNQLEEGFGTGFLIRGGDLAPGLGDELVLLTNAHVVSNDAAVIAKHGSLEPDQATIVFEAFEAAAGQKYRVKELLFTSPPEDLDASLLRLDPAVHTCQVSPVSKNLPALQPDSPQKVYVIGHPRGGGLSISLNDNLLLDWDDWKIHYRAPTEGGSSGSPVFNQTWSLIGLHHAGSLTMPRLKGQDGTYAANEGIWIQRIIKALKEAGVGTPQP